MADIEPQLLDMVMHASEKEETLEIRGSGSKHFLLPARFSADRTIDLTAHAGIISYEPTELVITARGGTPLEEITALLAQHNQMLPFDPPCFDGKGTIGGAIATGLAGPGRPWRGAPRDALLGVKLLDASGRVVSFGGQVMKNVAGYDISRLMCGAMGTLGILLEVSIRLIPVPRVERTLLTVQGYGESRELLNQMRRQSVPLTGAFWHQDKLHLRLSASSETALNKLHNRIGGEWLDDNSVWQQLRDHQLDFFSSTNSKMVIWRLSVPPAAKVPLQKEHLLDWGGGQHWIKEEQSAGTHLHALAQNHGGHLEAWFSTKNSSNNNIINKLQVNLQDVFNKNKRFNPGCYNA